MLAGRAHFRSFFADVDVAAVQADPFLRGDPGENLTFPDVFDELAVAFFMMLFDCSDTLEFTGNVIVAFFVCLFAPVPLSE